MRESAREAALTADKAGAEANVVQTKADHKAAVTATDQRRAAARMQEQEEHAALVAELRATLADLTSRGLRHEEAHKPAVAAMNAEHESTVAALGQLLEAKRDANTVPAAEVARLKDNLSGKEAWCGGWRGRSRRRPNGTGRRRQR